MKPLLFLHFLFICVVASAQPDTLSISLESVKYAYPVKYLNVASEGQDLRMAYMDVRASRPNGKTVMLFHGKNFAGYYWTEVIKALNREGYRVVVPDQIGFGKSSKPYIHYSFHLLSRFNKQLLDTLRIQKVAILGHSMGGMLATRFALMYPDRTEKLLLENPIGLEDYRAFVPYISTEEQYKAELKSSAESIKNYYQSSYFPQWKSEYNYLVDVAAGTTKSAEFPRSAKVSAMTFTMIYEQPVVHEFPNLKVPTVLFIGLEDKTIVGKGLLSKEEQASHGRYKILGKQIAGKIPNAKLIEFEGVGHIPHIQISEQFINSLLKNLN
ncbi:alpha/beta fold hydrolase [Pedobacter sp. SYSU D00535]|uniref:alpha/beta fold hydrolase n=1 Tax=Pedobacter sp. SYSU D00535 TaxID=2810308 RepID=UPI001A96B83B|nr:alpha/beta hydrolase [Pedobacter sp. SYSU D00535]